MATKYPAKKAAAKAPPKRTRIQDADFAAPPRKSSRDVMQQAGAAVRRNRASRRAPK